jgi:predicted RNase H-like HicB family nuclease
VVKKLILPVEIEVLEDGRYFAVCDSIQGCHAEGATIAEALENLEDGARVLLTLRREDGLPPPEGLTELSQDSVISAQVVVAVPE